MSIQLPEHHKRKQVIPCLPYQFYAWFFSPDQALPESVRPVAQNQQEVGF
ncbi:TPA: hypothetical protein JAD51_003014, partial [Proteus mirabilis]|nr:hypothetical protein [Proteus mirabilis]HAT5561637.1 hypothetical protein [Proteus mirabilis]